MLSIPAAVTTINPATEPNWYGLGNMVRIPSTGKLIAFARRGNIEYGAGEKGSVVKFESTDDGANWTGPTVVWSDPTYDARDPCGHVLASGRVLVNFKLYDQIGASAPTSLRQACRVLRSDDAGMTWAGPAVIADGFASWSGAAGRAAQLADGTVLQAVFGADVSHQAYIRVSRSTDEGVTWGSEVVLTGDPGPNGSWEEPQLVSLGGNRVVAFLRYHDFGEVPDEVYTYRSLSEDGGLTWTTPVRLFVGRGAPRTIRLSNGMLLMVGRQPDKAYGQVSRDEGVTWTAKQLVDHSSYSTMYYAGMAEKPDGSIALMVAAAAAGGLASDLHFKTLRLVGDSIRAVAVTAATTGAATGGAVLSHAEAVASIA